MKYQHWLASVQGISGRKKIMLQERMKTAEGVYYIEETALEQYGFLNRNEKNKLLQAKHMWKPDEEYEKLMKKEIQLITCFDGGYPKRLRQIPDRPYGIYYKGSLPADHIPSAALVGARNCTAYGEKHARLLAEKLVCAGVEIISGMAKGIDGAAQRGALNGGGKTYAILGCGVDICYPSEHIGLYTDILENGGGILSEFPPGMKPLAYNFPKRNRLISGLSDAVIVIEAREKSGSLITADMALEQGRDVYALPGPVDSALSKGCNRLIYQGAAPVLSAELLMQDLGIQKAVLPAESNATKKVLESKDNLVYSSVCLYPKSISQMIDELSLPAQEVMCALASLEIKGYIKEISKNYYIRN